MKLEFDVVASELRETLNQQVGNLKISASRSVAVVNSQLKTTFHSSAKWTATPPPVSRSGRTRRSLSPVRMMKWLAVSSSHVFSPKEGERDFDFMLHVGLSYQKWCDEWNKGLDKPSVASNMFMK